MARPGPLRRLRLPPRPLPGLARQRSERLRTRQNAPRPHERADLVWRGVAEASYLEDARVGEVLRQRGKTLEGIAYLLDLWREYPDSASIASDFFALSQVLARHAGKAISDPALRRELSSAG